MIEILISILPFALGVFHEWTAALLSVVLIVMIALKAKNNKDFKCPFDILFAASVILPLAFLVSPLWAVDKGITVLGFVKFLPLPLFLILLKNSPEVKDPFKYLPLSGSVMTVLSFILGLVIPKEGYFLVSNRLAGFFQYPNTFALFLLVALSLLLLKEKLEKQDYVFAPILLAGIVLSGSRTVFVLLMLFLCYRIITIKGKKLKLILAGAVVVTVLGSVVYVLATGNRDSVGRFLTTSFTSSTFIGRFLYFKDVLPQIIKHPFGLGYMGYFYSQGTFQTGVYSVNHVHNDLLQILIDVGWLPTILFGIAVVKNFIKIDMKRKIVVIIMILHLLFDFDMQFVAMDLIFLALIFDDETKGEPVKGRKSFIVATSVAALLSLYFAIPNFLSFINQDKLAVKVYPAYTKSYVALLLEADTADEMKDIADKIIKYDDSISIAYSAKARACFSEGDIPAMIENKAMAIERNKYSLVEYEDYIDMLTYCAKLYIDAENYDSAQVCINKIKEVPQKLQEVKDGTSSLAYKIKDKPELDLPAEYQEILNALD
ncbi:MAG: O-antigen ligase family protein [Clostridia bacterium]|nr:O-antigen ligase family protein [Clostridia bacterium]